MARPLLVAALGKTDALLVKAGAAITRPHPEVSGKARRRRAHHRVASLLRTEMHCQANRQSEIDLGWVKEFTALVNVVELDAADLDDAPTAPGRLSTLDAIHLAVAVGVGANLLVAYDQNPCRAAQAAGIRTGPG
nr:PIN domain-containing protein [Mycobacterium sp. UM_NZ2]